jgi:predicted PurR-regulated permease PerM
MSKGGVDTTIKFLIYLLIFLILVFAFVFLFVTPQIKGYQSAKSEYTFNTKQSNTLQKEQKELTSQLEKIKKENKNIIDIFSQEFNVTKFKEFSKKYFDDVQLTKINSDINNSALKIYQFNATIKAQNPKQFYNFVKELKKYNGLAKIKFPITISSQNNFLKINFHMSVYSMSVK